MQPARARILTPLRQRDFRLLWTGMTVSLLGDGIFLVAMPWQVYQLSDAPTALSFVGISMAVPNIVLLLVGGVVSDRLDRRRIMMAADVLRGVSVGVFGLLSLTGVLQLWHVMIIAAVFGAGTAFFGPAFDAIVPELVPDEHLTQANALDQFVRPAAWRMLGPALGGWVIAAFGNQAGAALLLDAVTFGVSVVCLLLMRARPARQAAKENAWREVKEGYRYVRSQTWLWGTLVAAAFTYLVFLGPTEVLLPWIVKNDMKAGAGDLGLILAMGGVGAMASALFMGRREIPRRNMTFIYAVWTLSTLSLAGYGLARFPWQAMAACFAFNALESAGTIVWITTKQRLVPNRLLGRVSSLDWFISIGLLPISLALTPVVAGVIGSRATLMWAGVIGAGVTLAFLFLPGLRDIEGDPALLGAHTDEDSSEPEPPPVFAAAVAEAPASNGPALDDTWWFPPSSATRPTPASAVPPVTANTGCPETGEPPNDPVVGHHLETLSQLRAAVARWQDARAELQAELQVLAAEEARLVQAGEITSHAETAESAVGSLDLGALREVTAELSAVADADPRSAELAEHATLVLGAAERLARDLREHVEQTRSAPRQLEETRQRLRALRALQDEYDRPPLSAQVSLPAGEGGMGPEAHPEGAKVTPPAGR